MDTAATPKECGGVLLYTAFLIAVDTAHYPTRLGYAAVALLDVLEHGVLVAVDADIS